MAAEHGYRGTPIEVRITPSFGGVTRQAADYSIMVVPPRM